ncbi:MotA/TolQ/ExbB proton channel family protein [Desulfomarina sp.]
MKELLVTQFSQFQQYVDAGGVIIIPLIVVSLVIWLLIVNRTLFFRRLHHKNMPAAVALEHIRENRVPDPGYYRGAVALLVTRFMEKRSNNTTLDRLILDETVLVTNRSLDNYLTTIGTLAAIAPLLGLLGTVTGMIATFDVLSFFGTGNARAMAGGISEALITTQTGLLVAIPGLYMKGFLERRAANLKRQIARVGYYLRRQL